MLLSKVVKSVIPEEQAAMAIRADMRKGFGATYLATLMKGPSGPSTRVAALACLPSGAMSTAAGQAVQ